MKKLTSTRPRDGLFWAITGFTFLVMLVFNCLTPFIADDFTFAFSYRTGQRLTGWWDVLQSQWTHYFTWSGRFVVKSLDQWFTIQPKILFNFFNTAVFVGLGLLVYLCAKGRRTKHDPLLLGLIFISFWMIAPVFGQTNLWMCGSFNYLWASFFCFSAATPYLLYLKQGFTSRRWMPALTLLLGLIGGWSSENTSAGLLVLLVLCMGWIILRKQKLPIWMVTGFVGCLVGYVLLILAPGNYLRSDTAEDTRGIATILSTRLIIALNMLWDYGMPLIVLFAVLYWLLWQQKPRSTDLFIPAALFVAGLAANFAMIASPVYYERSTHGVFVLLTAACATCVAQLNTPDIRRIISASAVALAAVMCFELVYAGYDIASFFVMHRTRTALILQQKAEGETDIVSYSIEPYTRWCSGYGLPDLRSDPDNWISSDMARYYGLNSLRSDEARTYPFPGRTNEAFEAGLSGNS